VSEREPVVLGRYLICDEIGGGGMARVHLGRVLGAAGFSRVVAIKRVHPANVDDANYATMLLDEARLVARIRHPNVVPTLDVVSLDGELILVMDYVHGPSLAWLRRKLALRAERMPVPIAVRIVLDVLAGLHAAHEAKSERGRPLEMVHRDVSPHNVLISDDGAARLADFGIAKADGKMSLTEHGQVKGKLSYMAPEQLRSEPVDRRADLFATGILLWELLTGRDLFPVPPEGFVAGVVQKILVAKVEPPSSVAGSPPALDAVVLQALRANRDERFATAAAMATALEASSTAASPKEVAAWIADVASDLLEKRARLVAQVEQTSAVHDMAALVPAQVAVQITARVQGSDHPTAADLDANALGAAPNARNDDVPGPTPAAKPTPTPKRKGLVVLLLAVALGSFGGAVVLAGAMRRGSADAATTTASAQAGVTAAATTTTSPPTAATSATTQPAGAASASTGARPSSAAPGSRRTPAPRTAPPDCDPPYSIDPQGVRIPRRECLDR
jgi:serine/threonine protein kinase